MFWHQTQPDRWIAEQSVALEVLDDFHSGIDEAGTAYVTGTFNVLSEHGHLYEAVSIRIEYPNDFPRRNVPPSVYLLSHRDKWIKGGNSHIESDWKLCLFVPGESGINFADANSLNQLFGIIQTFLFKEYVYQKRLKFSRRTGSVAEWPGEDRSHGEAGIKEAIESIGRIGRNSPCPCGSGKKYKHCHLRYV